MFVRHASHHVLCCVLSGLAVGCTATGMAGSRFSGLPSKGSDEGVFTPPSVSVCQVMVRFSIGGLHIISDFNSDTLDVHRAYFYSCREANGNHLPYITFYIYHTLTLPTIIETTQRLLF